MRWATADSSNGWAHLRRQAVISTNDDLLPMGKPLFESIHKTYQGAWFIYCWIYVYIIMHWISWLTWLYANIHAIARHIGALNRLQTWVRKFNFLFSGKVCHFLLLPPHGFALNITASTHGLFLVFWRYSVWRICNTFRWIFDPVRLVWPVPFTTHNNWHWNQPVKTQLTYFWMP